MCAKYVIMFYTLIYVYVTNNLFEVMFRNKDAFLSSTKFLYLDIIRV